MVEEVHGPARELRTRASFAEWALALTATSTMAVSYVDRQTLAVLAPTVRKALGISTTDYGNLLVAFAVAYLIGAPLAGRMIDFLGARRGLLGSVLGWSVVAALHALAPSFAVLLALRIALGLAESPSFPGAAQTVQRALPPAQRALGFGVLFCGSSVGAMIAPPLATYLESRFGFRVAFLGTAVAGLVWVPVWIAVAFSRHSRQLLEAAPPEPAPASQKAPVLEVLFTPPVLRLIALIFASAPFINLILNWAPSYLAADRGMAQRDMGTILVVPPLLFDAGAISFGLAASWLGVRSGRVAPPFLVGLAALLLAFGAAAPFAPTPFTAIVVCGVAMAGGAAVYALGTVDALARVPPAAVATVGGVGAAAQSIAQIVANKLIPFWVEGTGSYRFAFVVLGLWALPGALIWLVWDPKPTAVVR